MSRWTAALTSRAPVAAVSLEEVNVTWASALDGTVTDPTGQAAGSTLLPVLMAFPVSSGNPLAPAEPVTWFTGSWLIGGTSAGYVAQALVGPGGGVVTLIAGVPVDCWSKIIGTPESPVKYAGTITVI